MVPSCVVVLDTLPLTANGKLDRKALPETEPRPAVQTGYVAPRDEVERTMAEIWASVLGLPRVGVRDRFFELGGHSLLAVQVVARLAKSFGRTLPVAAIFEHGTIAELAPLLRTEATAYASTTSICEIQAQGERPPLYLVHGVGGGMFWGYANLARHLGPDQPVLAFKSRGLDGLPEWPGIEELATHYVSDLRVRQPVGPYQIGGYCFGGIVAFEMARQLEEQGETVATLALINCSPPNTAYEQIPEQPEWSWQRKFLGNVGYWLGCFVFRWTWPERVEFVRWKWRILRKRTGASSQQEAEALAITDVDEMVNIEAYSEAQRKLWQLHVDALRRYQPKPYGGRVTLLRTRGHALLCSFDELYGWGPLVRGGVKLRIVPGGHGNILAEPHVQTVARELERELGGGNPNADPAVKVETGAKKEYA
jgi:thioesterase domain-containing protein